MILICANCDNTIDDQQDPDCRVEVGNMRRLHETMILCARCRERREERLADAIGTEPPEARS